MLQPPVLMLRQSAELILPIAESVWHEQGAVNEYKLSRVRVERGGGTSVGAVAVDAESHGKLWYYPRWSMPVGLDLVYLKRACDESGVEMSVKYGGETYRVSRVNEFLDADGMAFSYEVELA